MPSMQSAQDLLVQELKEIHSAERQLSRALPRISKNTACESLRQMLAQRREQGVQLIEAIDEALEEIGTTKARKKNVAMEGLIEDINQHSDEIQDEHVLDAAVLASIQKVEHYCIASWGTAKSLGQLCQVQKVVDTMARALDEGRQFDQEMTQLAEDEVNQAMMAGEAADETEAEDTEEEPQARRGSGRAAEKSEGKRKTAS